MTGPTMPPSLVRWFDAAIPFVDGRGDLTALEGSLGPIAQPERMQLMPTFVRWQARHAMETLYFGLAKAWRKHDPGAFDRAIDAHLRVTRAQSGQPWSIGEGFAEALEEDESAPSWAAEMADLAWVCQQLRTTDVVFDRELHVLDPRLVVRFYAFALDSTVESPSAWLLYRSDQTDQLMRERASTSDVALILELQGGATSDPADPRAREESLSRLRSLGLAR